MGNFAMLQNSLGFGPIGSADAQVCKIFEAEFVFLLLCLEIVEYVIRLAKPFVGEYLLVLVLEFRVSAIPVVVANERFDAIRNLH
jgi:hypothetical protein